MIRSISFDDFCSRSYRQGRSQFLFSVLHPEDEVREYCQIENSHNTWAAEWRNYAAELRHARELDRLATIELEVAQALSTEFQPRLAILKACVTLC